MRSAVAPRFNLASEEGAVARREAHGGEELTEAEARDRPQGAEEEEADQSNDDVHVEGSVEGFKRGVVTDRLLWRLIAGVPAPVHREGILAEREPLRPDPINCCFKLMKGRQTM